MKKIINILLTIMLTLSLSACSLPGLGGSVQQNDVIIAGGDTAERQILPEINAQMMKHYLPEINTDLISNLASSLLILQTMTGGDTNVSALMYTGTSLVGELGLEPETNPEIAMSKVIKGYYEKYDMVWFPSYGFENTYAFMVKREFAESNGFSKVSDLKDMASELKAGVDVGWMTRQGDGYEAFKDIYGFDFDEVLPMQIGLVYSAVAAGEMDIVLGYSSDGRIQANDLVLLEDDLNLFPPYNGSPVITMELLEAHPEIIDVFLKLEGVLDIDTMQKLNRISDEDKVEARVIAKDFLEGNNYFEDKEIIPLDNRPDYKYIIGDLNKRISEGDSK